MHKNIIVLFYLDLQLLLELGIGSDRNYFVKDDYLMLDKLSKEEVTNTIAKLYESYKNVFLKSDILAFTMMEEMSYAEIMHYLKANVGFQTAKNELNGKINMILAMQQFINRDSWENEEFNKEALRLMKIGEKEFVEALFKS